MACFAPKTFEPRAGGHISHPKEPEGRQAPFKRLAGRSLQDIMGTAVLALIAFTTLSHAQTGDAAAQTGPIPQPQSASPEGTASAGDGLSDLNAVTFSC